MNPAVPACYDRAGAAVSGNAGGSGGDGLAGFDSLPVHENSYGNRKRLNGTIRHMKGETMGKAFKTNRSLVMGAITLDIGKRGSKTAIRYNQEGKATLVLTEDEANDLADALDDALDLLDSDPALWS